MWHWTNGAPKNFGVPNNISATAEASDFKFGAHLRFAKEHYKITGNGAGPWTKGAPQILEVPLQYLHNG